MTDLEWFKVLFGLAFALWLTATVLFASRYAQTIFRRRTGIPFVIQSILLALVNTVECALYVIAVNWQLDSPGFTRMVTYMIPIGLISQAAIFIGINLWVFRARVPNGSNVST